MPPQEDFGGAGTTPTITNIREVPTPREISRGLDEYVIGQQNVKVALSVGVYNHYKRIHVSESRRAAEAQRNATLEGVEVDDGG